jgi:superfamily II DNA/RNA helicase
LTFEDFNLTPELLEGILSMGYKLPSPVQQQAIPLILQSKDIIACAQTGTGKTAAYLLPVINKILQEPNRHLSTLIIAPTRELALQIDQQIEVLSYFTNISSIAVYGGGDGITWEQQKKALLSGTDIITATPGRLIAMLTTEGVQFDQLKYLILDEADRMLDMGFYDDIVRIISHLPEQRQTLLFSATMPPRIRTMAQRILKNPEIINIAISKPAEKINQRVYSVHDHQKMQLLIHLLKEGRYESVIIFASTKEKVRNLGATLQRRGLNVQAFHSDLEQSERESIMQQFKSGQLRILVGTDILSRGIDVEGIDLVVNYDVPGDAEDYIHRIGRTARASADGTAITFVNPADQRKLFSIESLIGNSVPQFPVPAELAEVPVYGPERLSFPRPAKSQKGGQPRHQGKKHHPHPQHRHKGKRPEGGASQ